MLSWKCRFVIFAAVLLVVNGRAALGGEKVIKDFETDSDVAFFDISSGKAELSGEHATPGKKSLKLAPGTYLSSSKMPRVWTGYDALEVDFFNDTGAAINLEILVGDAAWGAKRDYWNRYNASTVIPPGKSTFSLSTTGMYRGEAGSRFHDLKTPIDPGSIIRMDFGIGKAEKGFVYMGKIRLIKSDIPAGIFAFDFGNESQVLQPGFKPITWNTVYTKETGYGLRSALRMENRARDNTFPTKLYRDFVELSTDSQGGEFVVDLANGSYHVFIVYEDCGYWEGEAANPIKRYIEAEGKVAWSEDRGERGGTWEPDHHFENTEPKPGDDFWKLYMEYIFAPKEFDVEVADGQLNLKFFADKPWSSKVAAVIIYPNSIKAEGEKFVKGVVEAQRTEFADNAVEIATPAGGSLEAIPAEEKSKGYIFFLTDYAKDTCLTTVPDPAQIKREKSVYAALGRSEPVSFAVRPLKDMGKAKVVVGDFKGSAGVISADKCESSVVRHLGIRRSGISYSILPQMLRSFTTVDLPANLTREFYVTVRVPDDAAPGEYAGSITLTSDAGLNEVLNVKLTVLPFKLDNSDYVFGFFGAIPDEKIGRMLVEYGMNSLSGGPDIGLSGWDAKKEPILDFTAMDKYMAMLKRSGFSREICGYSGLQVQHISYLKDDGFFGKWEKETGLGYAELLKAVFDKVQAHAKEAAWLPFTYNLCDETRNEEVAANEVKQMKAIAAAAPWLKTTGQYSVTYKDGADPKNYHQWIFEALRSSGLNIHDESVMKKAKELGKEIYIYNQGQSRYSFGAYQWSEYSKEVRGRFQWILHIQHGFQFFDLDGREPDPSVIFYGVDGPIPTLALLRCRAGAEDFYYCQTLANLIKKNPGSPAAAEAAAMLKSVTDRIKVNENNKPAWLDEDKFRAQCAVFILKLMNKEAPEALKSKAREK